MIIMISVNNNIKSRQTANITDHGQVADLIGDVTDDDFLQHITAGGGFPRVMALLQLFWDTQTRFMQLTTLADLTLTVIIQKA